MKYSRPLRAISDRMRDRLNQNSTLEERRLHALANGLADKVQALEDLSANRSPTTTEAAHVQRIAERAKTLSKAREEAYERAHDLYREASVSLTDQLNRAARLVPSKYEAEIRQTLRAMPEKQRTGFLNQALKEGDSEVLAAVIEAPAVLSGVQPEIQDRYREDMWKAKAPDLYQSLEQAGEMFSETLAVLRNVNKAAEQGFDPDALREIEEAELRHQDAAQRFEAAT